MMEFRFGKGRWKDERAFATAFYSTYRTVPGRHAPLPDLKKLELLAKKIGVNWSELSNAIQAREENSLELRQAMKSARLKKFGKAAFGSMKPAAVSTQKNKTRAKLLPFRRNPTRH